MSAASISMKSRIETERVFKHKTKLNHLKTLFSRKSIHDEMPNNTEHTDMTAGDYSRMNCQKKAIEKSLYSDRPL